MLTHSNDGAGSGSRTIGVLLRMALLHGIEGTVHQYLSRGGNPNALDKTGKTALMLAAAGGHLALCHALVEAGAEPAVLDANGRSAATLAAERGYGEVATFLQTCTRTNFEDFRPGRIEVGQQLFDTSLEAALDEWTWEDDDALPPADEMESRKIAMEVQDTISLHTPVDADADWSDIIVELPLGQAGSRRIISDGIADRIRAAADEITRSRGSPATLLDLMASPATRRVQYLVVKAVYLQWSASMPTVRVRSLVESKNREAGANSVPGRDGPKTQRTGRRAAGNGAGTPAPQPAVQHANGPRAGSPPARVHRAPAAPPGSHPQQVPSRPLLTTWAARIWAAADEISARNGRTASISDIMAHAAARSMSYKSICKEYERWEAYVTRHGHTDASAGVPALNIADGPDSAAPGASVPAAPAPPPPGAAWDAVGRYLAEEAGLPVKDMRPMNGYFWVLLSVINTGRLRVVADGLAALGFEHMEGFGFRKK
jgi:hypothetical protein